MPIKPDQNTSLDYRIEYERLELVYKAMGGGLWDYNIDTDTLFCNARWYEILGLSATTNPITSIAAFIPYIHPSDRALATHIDEAHIASLMANDECYRIEYRIIRPSGETRWLRSVACLVREDETGHRRAIGCITDITEFRLDTADASRTPEPASIFKVNVRRGAKTEKNARAAAKNILTAKERECLRWVSSGKTAWETSVILGRSPRTVEFHLQNAMRKLDATNMVHAASIAIREALL